jgi:hypothetical protein
MKTTEILLGIVLTELSAFGATISIQPSPSVVSEGESFSLRVSVDDITDLYAFQFDIGFKPGLLAVTAITEGSFLSSAGPTFFIPGTVDNPAGQVAFTADTLVGAIPGANGNGDLALLQFSALRSGTSAVSLSNTTLLNSALATIAATPSDGMVMIAAPIPEPGSASLGCTAMIVAVCLRLVSKTRSAGKLT